MDRYLQQQIKKTVKGILLLPFFLFSFLPVAAQDLMVQVSATRPILPPQVGSYINTPEKFFVVRVTNNSSVTQNIYFGMQVHDVTNGNDLIVSTPPARMPQQAIVVPANYTKTLSAMEMHNLFNHLLLSDIYVRSDIFNEYNRGSQGLLPEGFYSARLTAYKYDPTLTAPVPLNDPNDGMCTFQVCYIAQAPTFSMPQFTNGASADDPFGDFNVATMSRKTPMVVWTPSTIACQSTTFTYDIKIVHIINNQPPDDAIMSNGTVYENYSLTATSALLPDHVMKKLEEGETYAVQVTAKSPDTKEGSLSFVLINNDGKSSWRMFRVTDGDVVTVTEEKDKDDGESSLSLDSESSEKEKSSLYSFSVPTLTKPVFEEGRARKIFVGEDIHPEWRKAWFKGGKGERQDTVKWKYNVQLFSASTTESYEEIFAGKPVYNKETEELEATIKWDDIAKSVKPGDYLVMRIEPKCQNKFGKDELTIIEDSTNIKDFALTEHISQLFECKGGEAPKNQEPLTTELKAGDVVHVGAYDLTLKTVERVKDKKCFKGTGHIAWNPGIFKIAVAVKFDSLYINTDKYAYKNQCYTYPREDDVKGVTNAQVVDQLFSDWGLDNLVGDTSIPFASEIQEGISGDGKSGLNDLAEKLDIQQYYSYYKLGMTGWDDLKNLELTDCHMPIRIPEEYNSSPVDIQIASMVFSATTAYMNLFGAFELPENERYDNDILIFGAPQLCVEPDKLIPESGTVSMFDNFTFVDPKTNLTYTFKAPNDVSNPKNGCYLHWQDSKFSVLHAEMEMRVPNLKKVVQDKVLEEMPIINLEAEIESWESWWANGKMDMFQSEDLPGWTFVPGEMGYDHSDKVNLFDKLPADYKTDADVTGIKGLKENPLKWQGVYFKDMGVRFPKVIKFDDDKGMDDYSEKDGGTAKALSTKIDYMMIDQKFSANFSVNKIFDGSTTSCGGWALSIDKAECAVLQNNFHHAGLSGAFTIPLLKQKNKKGDKEPAKINYLANMYLQDKGKERNPVWVFATTQQADISLDFFLAEATFDKKQTYFLIESDEEEEKPKIELCLGGHIDIAGANKLKLPGIKFTRMRLANCPRWESKYLKTAGDLYKELEKSNASQSDTDYAKELDNLYQGILTAKGYEKDALKGISLDGGELKNSDGTVRFDIGRWSFASPEKKVAGFDFTVTDFDLIDQENDFGLKIGGKLKMLGGEIEASTTVRVLATVDWSDLGSISYKGTYFDGAEVHSGFGGIMLDGEFTMPDNGLEGKGYQAKLKMTMPGDLFTFDVLGAWMEKEKTAEERKLDQQGKGYNNWLKGGTSDYPMSYAQRQADRATRLAAATAANDEYEIAAIKSEEAGDVYGSKTYTWGYLVVSLASKNGIQAPPIQINGVKGGFYFNCKNGSGMAAFEQQATEGEDNSDKGIPAYGMVGGLLGVKISTSGSSKAINGDMQLTVFYDMKQDRLSTISLFGTVHALCGEKEDDGLINAKAKMVYSCTDKDKYFDLDITSEGGVDMKDDLAKLAGEASGILKTVSEKSGLGTFAPDEKDPNRYSKTGNEESVDKGKTGFEASMGFKVSMNFRITWKRNGTKQDPTKWHLYIGRPPQKERCELRLIDFALGKKDDAFALWCSIGANAYLCVGNELVDDDGKEYGLPAIPDKIAEFLGGTDISGNSQNLTGEAESKRQGTLKEFKEPSANKNSAGGIMFGATAWGDFGVNAGIVYARATLMAGFDLALKKLAKGTRCIGGKEMGSKNGYYAMGQIYALAMGELGLMINCWLFKGEIPLVSVGLGALLKGGFPNPSWCYGKMKAKYKLLGGLIKGSTTVELKVGEVCVPEFGNPLDDIKIFEDMSPGSEDDLSEGWSENNVVSPFSTPRFTTNMVMDNHIRILDKNIAYSMANYDEELEKYTEQASRTYVFHLDQTMQLEIFADPDPDADKNKVKPTSVTRIPYTTTNHMSYSLGIGTMTLNTGYRVVLSGYAKEIVNGKEVDPIFNDSTTNWKDVHKEWRDSVAYYFRSSNEPPSLSEAVAIFHTDYQADLERPTLAMRWSFANLLNDPQKPVRGRLEYWNEDYDMWLCPDVEATVKCVDVYGNEKPDNVDVYGRPYNSGGSGSAEHHYDIENYNIGSTRYYDPVTGRWITVEINNSNSNSSSSGETHYFTHVSASANQESTTTEAIKSGRRVATTEAVKSGRRVATTTSDENSAEKVYTVASKSTGSSRGIAMTSATKNNVAMLTESMSSASLVTASAISRVSQSGTAVKLTTSESNSNRAVASSNANRLKDEMEVESWNRGKGKELAQLANEIGQSMVAGTGISKATSSSSNGISSSSSSSSSSSQNTYPNQPVYTNQVVLSKPNSKSQFYNMPLTESNDGDLIFIYTQKTIDRKYLVPGRTYRFSLCQVDEKAYSDLVNKVDSIFKARKRMTSTRTSGKGGTSVRSGRYSSTGGQTTSSSGRRGSSSRYTSSSSRGSSTSSSRNTSTTRPPSSEPTVNLSDYMDEIIAQAEKELGMDADTTRHIKLQDRLDLANYSVTLYSKLSKQWAGVHTSQFAILGTTDNRRLEKGSWYDDWNNRPDFSFPYGRPEHYYVMLRKINRSKSDLYKKTDNTLVDEKLFLKDPHLCIGYWARWAMIGGYKINTTFDSQVYTSGEGFKLDIDNGTYFDKWFTYADGQQEKVSVSVRPKYNLSGLLMDLHNVRANIASAAKDIGPSMGYDTNPAITRYRRTFSTLSECRNAIEGCVIGNDIYILRDFYNKLAQLKSDYLKYVAEANKKSKQSDKIKELAKLSKKWNETYRNVKCVVDQTIGDSYMRIKSTISFPYYQIPLLYSLTFEKSGDHNKSLALPGWRMNTSIANAVWNGIPTEQWKLDWQDMWKTYTSFEYELYRLNCYHNKMGYTVDTKYGYVEGYGPKAVCVKTVTR